MLLTKVQRFSPLKAWSTRLVKRIGARKGRIAVARKIAVILHCIWVRRHRILVDARGGRNGLERDHHTSSAPAEAPSLPGRRVAMTARRPWAVLADAGSGRFTHRGVTPLTPIMGRTTDPGENHDPGNERHSTKQLDPGAPIRERSPRILQIGML